MIIDFNKIKNIDTSIYKKDFDFPGYPGPLDYTHHLFRETGEHYKLLTYISHLYDDILILDVGTNWGESAVSLAQNPRNKIITYDIRKIWELPFLDNYSNLEFKLMDISKESDNIIKSAKIIFLDIAHDGMQEWSFTDRLLSIGYKGYLICDDIFAPFYPMMKPWWDSINIEKYDLTEIGHTWGTGLVNYYRNNDVKIIR